MHPGEGPILVFDGVCLLCNRSVHFVLRHDREARYRFASVQSASGHALLLAHGLDPGDPLSMLLCEGERAYTDSEAVLRILESFGGAHRMWRIARIVPKGIRDRIYRWVARNRYRWFGRTDTCWLPSPEFAARFLP
jgi:predicted DCC family thiol-disulfide oxidoreductase YuxK